MRAPPRDDGKVEFEVTISAASGATTTVDYATSDGTATAGEDYTATSSTLTFPANSTSSLTISVQVTDDTIDEVEQETFTLTLSNTSGGELAGGMDTLSVTGTITDNDDPQVTVSFGESVYSAAEGGTVEVTVTLNTDPERSVTIPIASMPQGGAMADADYSGVPTDVTIESGATSTSFTFTAAEDDIDDDGESVGLAFGTLPPGVSASSTSATTTVNITDDDIAGVTVVPTLLTVTEGSTSTYTVVLDSEPSSNVAIEISGHSGTDLTLSTTTLSFTSGNWSTAQTVTVTAGEDLDAATDPDVVLLHTVTGAAEYASVTADSVTVTITENDVSTLSVSNASAAEGDGSVVFEVTISAASGATTTVDYATSDGTANAGEDYTAASSTLTFPANSTSSLTISVQVTDDTIDEDEQETFTLTLSNATVAELVGGESTLAATGTIIDNDDPQVTVGFGESAYSAAEGGTVEVTVTLNANPERSVTVPIVSTGQGASADDYSGVPADVTFQSGETEQSFTFTAAEDDIDDDGESVGLAFGTLPPGVSASSTSATTTVSITDDDIAGVTVVPTSLTVTEGSTTTYSVVLDTKPTADVTIEISGHSGTDVSVSTSTLAFTAEYWNTAQRITVIAEEDVDAVADNAVVLSHAVTGTGEYQNVTADSVTVTIAENDVPTLFVGNASAAEDDGNVVFEVTISAASDRPITVDYATSDRTATAGEDYTTASSTLTFPANSTSSLTISVPVTDDTIDEVEQETFALTLSSVSGAELAGGEATLSATGTIVDNDSQAGKVTLLLSPSTIDESGTDNVSTVTASLGAAASATTTVAISTAPTSAAWFNLSVNRTLTIAAGDTTSTGTVTITAVDDNDYTGNREVTVSGSASNEVGVTDPDDVRLTITEDDDVPVNVSFERGLYSASEGSGVSVTVTLSAAPERNVQIPLIAMGQDGATTADYSVPAGVSFGVAETRKSFTFTAVDDSHGDGGESVELSFGTLPPSVSDGATTTATVTISDNDSQLGKVTLFVSPNTISENVGSADVTAGLSSTSTSATIVTISVNPTAAVTVIPPPTLTIAAGDTTSTAR